MRVLLFLTLFCFVNFSTPEDSEVEYVIWGTYCGECSKDCATFFKVTEEGEFYKDTSEKFFRTHFRQPSEPYQFHGRKINKKVKSDYQWVKKEIPKELYAYPNGEIGEPDHYDQCGYYLQIKKGETISFWKIDPLKIPDNLKAYIERLLKISAANNS
jgi:hypothetical protein